MAPPKKKVGRPKKKLGELPSNWQEEMLAMAEVGASDVELRTYALGGISDDLWYRLIDEEPEFSRTVKRCKQLCQAWWEREGRTNLDNSKFSPTLWYMNMKNRFGWKDKHDISSEDGSMTPRITEGMSAKDAALLYKQMVKEGK